MKTIQKLFASILAAIAVQTLTAQQAPFHPITKCASLTFQQGNQTPISINKPVGNAAWDFSSLGTGTFTVTDCDGKILGTYNTSTGIFTPSP